MIFVNRCYIFQLVQRKAKLVSTSFDYPDKFLSLTLQAIQLINIDFGHFFFHFIADRAKLTICNRFQNYFKPTIGQIRNRRFGNSENTEPTIEQRANLPDPARWLPAREMWPRTATKGSKADQASALLGKPKEGFLLLDRVASTDAAIQPFTNTRSQRTDPPYGSGGFDPSLRPRH